MKLLFLGNFSDRKHEGLVSISKKLSNHFQKVSNLKINYFNNIDNFDIICYHSSGFYDVVKLSKLNTKTKKIFSLHSNIVPIYWKALLDSIQNRLYLLDSKSDHLNKKKRFSKTLISLISHNTPLFVKKYFLNKCDLVILPNKWLSKKLNLKNSVVIRHGININKFKHLKIKRTKKIIISFFGHPTSDKGILDVLTTFSKFDSKFFSKRVYFTTLNDKIIKTVKKYDKTIHILGSVENIVKEYNRADIIILPYRHSSGAIATPLVLIEAMACERAIITSNLPHLKEICGDSVLYVNPYDEKDIFNKINLLSNNKKLRDKLGKLARERVIKFYNEEDMFKSYDKLFKKI